MKKIFLLLLFLIPLLIAQAQTEAKPMIASNGLAQDTVSNTGTETWTLKVAGFQKTVSVQAVITKISGTVAGTYKLQGSLTGTDYVDIASQTASATDVTTNTAIFTAENSKYLYYRVTYTGSGTMSARARCYLVARD